MLLWTQLTHAQLAASTCRTRSICIIVWAAIVMVNFYAIRACLYIQPPLEAWKQDSGVSKRKQ